MVQGEWNTLKMGKSNYATECKLVRFKTIYIESLESSESVPLMTDGVINVSSKIIKLYDTIIDLKFLKAEHGYDVRLHAC